MQALAQVKMLLLDVLESAFQAGDVHATQQLGVNMTQAVKRDGVVIIQNQNVEVYTRIMPLMVKALKACDAMESPGCNQPTVQIEPQRQLLPPPADDADTDADPIDVCCAWLYENHVKWQDMQDLMRSRYLEYVIGRSKTKNEAARWLGVGNTYLCKLSKTVSA
jgi:hypothetical protein